jgi:hypothetical protein
LRLWDEIANSEWRAINCNQLQKKPTLCDTLKYGC